MVVARRRGLRKTRESYAFYITVSFSAGGLRSSHKADRQLHIPTRSGASENQGRQRKKEK